MTDGERWEARREMRRREWFRSWAEARERERIARLNGGEANGGMDSDSGRAAGDVTGSRDVRGP